MQMDGNMQRHVTCYADDSHMSMLTRIKAKFQSFDRYHILFLLNMKMYQLLSINDIFNDKKVDNIGGEGEGLKDLAQTWMRRAWFVPQLQGNTRHHHCKNKHSFT